MTRVAVVGGGLGGLATAARLAKSGHEVTLVEAGDRLGGAMTRVEADGFTWDAGPAHTLLPAVMRDLFRKSGRPLDAEVELVPVTPARQHRFDDRSVLDLPSGSRGDQIDAITVAFDARAAEDWTRYVDGFAEVWELLRTNFYERPWSEEYAPKEAVKLLKSRMSLYRHTRGELRDERLRQVASHRVAAQGSNPKDSPYWLGVWNYVEQNFGTWTAPGGMSTLADALVARMDTRGVTVVLDTRVTDIAVEGGKAVGIRTDEGTIDADRVVVCIDPRRLPSLAMHVERTAPALPPLATYLGIVGEVPEVPAEIVVHGEPTMVIRTTGAAPVGAHAWTVFSRGGQGEDVLNALYRAGLKVRDQVEVRVDRTAVDLARQWNGSPMGLLWQGRGAFESRLGPQTPINGVLLAGAHTRLGGGIPEVGLSAALVAQLI